MPTLMARATAEGEEVYEETRSRLLELAAVNQAVFRTIVTGMSVGQRDFLEQIIKANQKAAAATDDDSNGAGQPSITLKMDFGS